MNFPFIASDRQKIRVNGRGVFYTNSACVEFTDLNQIDAYPINGTNDNSLYDPTTALMIHFELNGWLWINHGARYNLYQPDPYVRFQLPDVSIQQVQFWQLPPPPRPFEILNITPLASADNSSGCYAFVFNIVNTDTNAVADYTFYSPTGRIRASTIFSIFPAYSTYVTLDIGSGWSQIAPNPLPA